MQSRMVALAPESPAVKMGAEIKTEGMCIGGKVPDLDRQRPQSEIVKIGSMQ